MQMPEIWCSEMSNVARQLEELRGQQRFENRFYLLYAPDFSCAEGIAELASFLHVQDEGGSPARYPEQPPPIRQLVRRVPVRTQTHPDTAHRVTNH